jgi:hypothetical protein
MVLALILIGAVVLSAPIHAVSTDSSTSPVPPPLPSYQEENIGEVKPGNPQFNPAPSSRTIIERIIERIQPITQITKEIQTQIVAKTIDDPTIEIFRKSIASLQDRITNIGVQANNTVSSVSLAQKIDKLFNVILYSPTVQNSLTILSGGLNIDSGSLRFPDGTIQTTAAGSGAAFWASSGTNIYNTNTGKIGIGTSSPVATLDISSAAGKTNIRIYGSGDTFNYSEIKLGSPSSDWNLLNRQFSDFPRGFMIEEYNGATFNARFAINAANVNNGRIYLNPLHYGGVSIGSQFTIPAPIGGATRLGDLHVFRSGDLSGDNKALVEFAGAGDTIDYAVLTLEAYKPADNYPHWSFVIRQNNDISGRPYGLGYVYWNGATYDLKMVLDTNGRLGVGTTSPWGLLSVNAVATSSPQFVIGSSTVTQFIVAAEGNVGLGLTNPAKKLDVAGDIQADSQLQFTGSIGGFAQIQALNNKDLQLQTSGSGNIVFNPNSAEKMRISNAGSVGISSTSPWRIFSVVGTVGFSSSLTSATTGNYLCINTSSYEITSGTTCSASSERFKEDIHDISYGLETVLKLRPVSFRYKKEVDPNDRSLRLGFVAEEVNQLAPELVAKDKEGKPESVDYAKLTSVLTKAIQQLDQKVANHGGIQTVQSTTQPTGITVYDKKGKPGCISIEDISSGVLELKPGVCGSSVMPTAPPALPAVLSWEASSTMPEVVPDPL